MRAVKTITGNVTRAQNFGIWDDVSNPVTNGRVYQWRLTMTITIKTHSDATTKTPYQFDGTDIEVGSWFADYTGRVYKVVSFITQTPTSVVVVCEDTGFENSYNASLASFNGAPGRGQGLFFEASPTGQPILDGIVDGTYPPPSVTNILTRFARQNPTSSFVLVNQSNHGFNVGDLIKLSKEADGYYELSNSAEGDFAVGIVSTINEPSSSYFSFKPLGEIVDNVVPGLVGAYGDVFYEDHENPGKLTTVRPSKHVKPIYIRLETENRAVLINTVGDTNTITKTFESLDHVLDQVEFTLPEDTLSVDLMSINGIENNNFTFDPVSKLLTFDPVATGYGVDEMDEVIFIYKS